tara:strand:- start:24 stop:260 length:237 start_codon:yes stop_codon:yes gene_type:complete
MRYIVFARSIDVDIISRSGDGPDLDAFIEEAPEFFCFEIVEVTEEILPIVMAKVERYGSYIFTTKKVYDKLKPYSDDE